MSRSHWTIVGGAPRWTKADIESTRKWLKKLSQQRRQTFEQGTKPGSNQGKDAEETTTTP